MSGPTPPEQDDGLISIGEGVQIRFTCWGEHPVVGLIEYHRCAGGNCRDPDGSPGLCGGGVLFDLPGVAEAFPDRELWRVESWDPLTLTPSLLCGCTGCTHHGWIREGRWHSA